MADPKQLLSPAEGSLRRTVVRGAFVTGLSQGVRLATQIAAVVVLSRLLEPTDFGLVAMCAPVIALAAILQDFGLLQATVQKKNLQLEEVNFLFWVNVGVSVTLALLLAAASPALAAFYNDARVGPLIAALSLTLIAGGMGAQHLAILNRRMEFDKIAISTAASAIMTFGGSVLWAVISPTYWALFGGSLLGAITGTLFSWRYSQWRPGRPRGVATAGALLGFGGGITGHGFANFFARHLDNVLIGRFWGPAQLGLYDRAYKLLLFPLQQVSNPLARVMIPALSQIAEEPDRYRHAFLRVLNLSLLVSLPAVAVAIVLADRLIALLLGGEWAGSVPIYTALGFAGLLQPLNNPAGWLLISQGRSTHYFIVGVATAILASLAFIIGLPWGAIGVAVAYSIAEYIKIVPLWLYVSRTGPLHWRHVLHSTGPKILAAHGSVAMLFLVRDRLPDDRFLSLMTGMAISYTSFIVLLLPFSAGRATLREAFSFALAPLRAAGFSR